MTTHPCELRCGQKDTSGTIVSIRDRILVVAVHEDLWPHIAHARVTADDSFLIVRLCERLQEVQAGTAQFNMDSAKRVIGARATALGVLAVALAETRVAAGGLLLAGGRLESGNVAQRQGYRGDVGRRGLRRVRLAPEAAGLRVHRRLYAQRRTGARAD